MHNPTPSTSGDTKMAGIFIDYIMLEHSLKFYDIERINSKIVQIFIPLALKHLPCQQSRADDAIRHNMHVFSESQQEAYPTACQGNDWHCCDT